MPKKKSKAEVVSFKSKIYKLTHLLNATYVEVPADVVKTLGTLKIRLICTVNGSISFQCGLMALKNGSAYITLNSKRMKELGVKPNDTVSVSLTKDESKYGMDVPEELEELLKQDDEAKRRFDLLAPGMQRYIIYYVSQVKSSNLRLERSLKLMNNLKKLKEGKEDFRQILGKEAKQ